jgi:two-component system LytT family sensor kinase
MGSKTAFIAFFHFQPVFCEICSMKHRRILFHLAFWLAYGLYDGYLNAPISGTSYEHLSFMERMGRAYLAEIVVLCYKVPLTYSVLYFLVPQYFTKRNLPVFLGSIGLVAIVGTVIAKLVWFNLIYPFIYEVSNPEPVSSLARQLFRWLWNSIDILLLLSVASAIKFFRLSLASAEREKHLVAEKLQSELNFLRAQTNPHFLFNTLNNLYHLARKRSEDTPDAILKLSELLRFMLYECTATWIPISKEVKVIRDYLELERLRYGERLRADFRVEMDEETYSIAPLLLLPFVENAFKHGASESRGNTWVAINLQVKNGMLTFMVENPQSPSNSEIVEGIGLKNVKRQLELIYPNHELTLDNQGDKFVATLKLQVETPLVK